MSRRAAGLLRGPAFWEASVVCALLGLAALAWVATGRLASPAMRVGVLTGGGSTPPGTGARAVASLGLFLLTWTVMMAAMMLPAVVPVVLTLHRWVTRIGRSRSATAFFVAGYLLVWGASGMAVYALIIGATPFLPSGEASVRLGASVLLLAGAYQFTSLKDACLRQCRSPMAFIAEHTAKLVRGGLARAQVGAVHGVFCLGCCWAIMLVLVPLGMMSLSWMAAVAGAVLLERLLSRRWPVRGFVGLALLIAGATLLVLPRTLPALA